MPRPKKPVERLPQVLQDVLDVQCKGFYAILGTKPVPHFVYVIRSEFGYKIGKSRNPQNRFSSLQTSSPVPLKLVLIKAVKHMHRTEEVLHALFASKRLRGEWFSLTSDDLATIQTLTEEQIQEYAYSLGIEVAWLPDSLTMRPSKRRGFIHPFSSSLSSRRRRA